MKLAINAQQLASTHRLTEAVDVVCAAGVDAIEVWPQNLGGGESPEERERYECKDVAGARRLLDSRNVSVACVTLGFNAMSVCIGKGGVQRGTEALMGAVDAAATLQAEIVNCYLAGVPAKFFIEAAKPAAEYAGSKGVTIVLENEAHDESAAPEGVRAMIEAIGSPHFGTEYDPCNYYHAYEEPYPGAYEVLKDHIRYVHLKGGVLYDPHNPTLHRGSLMRGRADRHIGYVPLPDSAFNMDAILNRLRADRYQGYVTLEPHVAAQKAIEFYKIEVPYVKARLNGLRPPT